MSGSWNAHDRLNARMAACKGNYSPHRYTLRVDDDHARWRYRLAASGFGMQVPDFFIFCTEYVIRHRRELKEVRRTIRLKEAAMRREKRRRQLEDKRERREALKRWRG